MNDVRKNAGIVLGGLSEQEVVESGLKDLYGEFISGLEGLDGQAGLGQRGRKNVDVKSGYDKALNSLEKFVTVADALADVPVQYTKDASEQ